MKLLDKRKEEKKAVLVRNPDIPKQSSFLVTVNSNQTTESLKRKKIDPEKFAVRMEQIVSTELEMEGNYIPREDDELSSKDIFSIRVSSSALEIGPQKGTYHVHALVTIRYRNTTSGYFHINIREFKKALLAQLSIADIYVNVRYAKSVHDTITNYIEKQKQANPNFDLNEHNYEIGQKRRKKTKDTEAPGEAGRAGEAVVKRKPGRPRKVAKRDDGDSISTDDY